MGIGQVLDMLLTAALWLIVARAILSWVSPDPSNQIVRFINSATDPLLRPIQSRIPPIGGGIDISPILVIFLIYFLKQALVGTLFGYAREISSGSRAFQG